MSWHRVFFLGWSFAIPLLPLKKTPGVPATANNNRPTPVRRARPTRADLSISILPDGPSDYRSTGSWIYWNRAGEDCGGHRGGVGLGSPCSAKRVSASGIVYAVDINLKRSTTLKIGCKKSNCTIEDDLRP